MGTWKTRSPGGHRGKTLKVIRLLRVKEGSFVPRGANQHAHLGLLKELANTRGTPRVMAFLKDGGPPPTLNDVLGFSEFWEEWYELRYALEDTVRMIQDCDAANKVELLNTALEQFAGHLAELKSTVALEKIDAALAAFLSGHDNDGNLVNKGLWSWEDLEKTLDLCEAEANAPARPTQKEDDPMRTRAELLALLAAGAAATFTKEETAEVNKAFLEAHAKTEALTKERDALVKDKETLAKEKVDLQKQLPTPPAPVSPETMALITKEREEKAVLIKRMEDLEAKDTAREVENLTKELGAPGVDNDKLRPLIKALHKTPELDNLRQIMKGARATSDAVAKLTKELGRASLPEDGSPEMQVTNLVKEAMRADPKLNAVDAEAKVYKEHPELTRQIKKAERDAAVEARF